MKELVDRYNGTIEVLDLIEGDHTKEDRGPIRARITHGNEDNVIGLPISLLRRLLSLTLIYILIVPLDEGYIDSPNLSWLKKL